MSWIVQEERLSTAAELLALLSPWSAGVDLTGFIFRGHANDQFNLVPSVFRQSGDRAAWEDSFNSDLVRRGSQRRAEEMAIRREYRILREFFRECDKHALPVPVVGDIRRLLVGTQEFASWPHARYPTWPPDEMLELAGMAQHYGLPTRLLDWSYDPLIAAFFAADGPVADNLCIWGLDSDQVMALQSTEMELILRLVVPPYHTNPNLAAQSGVFTILIPDRGTAHGAEAAFHAARLHLDQYLDSRWGQADPTSSRSLLIKYILPGEEAPALLGLLARAGYDRARVYPGYASVAKQVAARFTSDI